MIKERTADLTSDLVLSAFCILLIVSSFIRSNDGRDECDDVAGTRAELERT